MERFILANWINRESDKLSGRSKLAIKSPQKTEFYADYGDFVVISSGRRIPRPSNESFLGPRHSTLPLAPFAHEDNS